MTNGARLKLHFNLLISQQIYQAILGSREEAQEYQELPPEEAKKR